MATTFGTRPEDTVADSRGNVLSGVVLKLYPTEADATNQTSLVATVQTNVSGQWPYSDDGARSMLWVRDPAGNVWPIDAAEVPSKVDDAVVTLGNKADKGTPTWSTGVGSFDRERGLYNFSAKTLTRFRKAKADAIAGNSSLHIAVLGDSTTHRASDTLRSSVVSWPARTRDHMLRVLGLQSSGTGIIHLWNTTGESSTEPRVSRIVGANGVVTDQSSLGVYGVSALAVACGADTATRLEFTPSYYGNDPDQYADEIWLYMIGTGSRAKVTVTNGAGLVNYFDVGAYVGHSFTPDPGYTAVAPETGYVRTSSPGVSGGLVVARLPVTRRNDWIVQVRTASGETIYVAAVESRDTTRKGLRVSNVAQAGVALSALVQSTNDSSGSSGLPLGVDATQAHLYVIALGLNDWQGHGDVATFKTQLTTTVQRCKATGTTGSFGYGTAPGADVVLMIQPQPNYATNPPDHVLIPALTDYWAAMYQVADEQGVALIDNSYRWTDYATSSAMFRDGIHPSTVGAADIGIAVGSVLASV